MEQGTNSDDGAVLENLDPENLSSDNPTPETLEWERVYRESGPDVRPFLIRPTLDQVPLALLQTMARLDAAIEPNVFGTPVKYNLEEFAAQAGTTEDRVTDLAKWIGQPARNNTEVRYSDADVTAVKAALAYKNWASLSEDDLKQLIRGIGHAMEQLAARQVEAMVERLSAHLEMGDTEARLVAADRVPWQAPQLAPLVDHIYRRHFASAVRRLTIEALTQRGLLSDDDDYPLLRAVGFADLVGFTERTEHATAAEFRELVSHFRNASWDIISAGGGRIINFIGDAVFFSADTMEAGARIALKLAEPGVLMPDGEARIGLAWRRVLSTFGDLYGAGVNLAARLCAAADPSEVMVGPKAAYLLADLPEFELTPERPFNAHGIGMVQPFHLRYADVAK